MDVLVLVLALLAGISGARQGMVTAAASFIGVLTGAVIGVRIAPSLIEGYQSPEVRVALGVSIVIVLIAIGEMLGVLLGRAVQRRIDAEALRQMDSFLGAVVQGIAALVVAWLVALPLSKSSVYTGLTGAVRDSSVLRIVDTIMPNVLRDLPAELTILLDVSGFPYVLAPFSPTPMTDVVLGAPVLPLAPKPAISGLSGLVLGYPLDGPYTASAARVRDRIHLRGPDIYNASTVVRNVYTVRAVVRSGNSGGPLLDGSGQVLGLVFGAAVDNDETGFVLTDDEIADDVATASSRNVEVSTGTCAS